MGVSGSAAVRRALERVVSVDLDEDDVDESLTSVVESIDAWDEKGFELVRLALGRRTPAAIRVAAGAAPGV